MKQHIKAARSYRMELPTTARLEAHFAAFAFRELAPTDPWGIGFVAPTESGTLVIPTTDPGIGVFAVRYDEKILPAAVIKAEVAKTIADIYEREGRRVGRKEARDLRETLIPSLLAKSHTKTTILRVFYNYRAKLLIVPTASKKLADAATSLMLKAVESIKVTTIYVAGANASLTTRLNDELFGTGDLGFDQFNLTGRCALKDAKGGKVAIDLFSLNEAAQGVQEALHRGATVEEVGLEFATCVTFRLTQDFVLKDIKWEDEAVPESDDEVDADYRTRQEMAVEAITVMCIVDDLCAMLGYNEPEAETSGDLF